MTIFVILCEKERTERGENVYFDALLYPGTLVCRRMGIDPESDQGLIRSMFNMLIYLIVILCGLWAVM
jgi:hypothetical protein